MFKWLIEVGNINEHEKVKLMSVLTGDYVQFHKDQEGVYITSPRFDGLVDYDDVKKAAKELFMIISGSGQFQDVLSSPMSVAGIQSLDDTGTKTKYIFVCDHGNVMDSIEVQINGMKNSFNEPLKMHDMAKWIKLSSINEEVKRALRIVGDGISWVNLYKVFEIIEKDMQGADVIISSGWVTRNNIQRFKHTSNSPHAIGDEARHGSQSTASPKLPMSLSEAKNFIGGLLHNWIGKKLFQRESQIFDGLS